MMLRLHTAIIAPATVMMMHLPLVQDDDAGCKGSVVGRPQQLAQNIESLYLYLEVP